MYTFFLEKNIEIGHYSGYRTTVYAEYFYELQTEGDISKLHEIYVYSEKMNIPLLFIGGGTNILFSKDYYDGIVVKNNLMGWNYDMSTKILETSSNESIWQIAEDLEKKYNEPLWHRWIGLPGSIGGAIYGNAGCFGLDTEHNLISVKIYDMKKGEIKIVKREDIGFGYRHSMFKKYREYFIISAIFDLSTKVEKYHSDVDNIYFREHKQPKGYSCGSFWKNPTSLIFSKEGKISEAKPPSAGSLIEAVGLKGYRHGGARWSDLHANFLLSDGSSCRPEDLIELIELTHEKVKTETGYTLINEVQII